MLNRSAFSTALHLKQSEWSHPFANNQGQTMNPMRSKPTYTRLEDIPNIGKSIAADLRDLGIVTPQQLAKRDPLKTYLALSASMGRRHDPCVLYTLMAAKHYLDTGEPVKWWKFTEQGKALLATQAKRTRK